NGAMMRTGRCGQFCACAPAQVAHARTVATAVTAANIVRMLVMRVSYSIGRTATAAATAGEAAAQGQARRPAHAHDSEGRRDRAEARCRRLVKLFEIGEAGC